jgi:uncharacterized protein (DUF2062 family)
MAVHANATELLLIEVALVATHSWNYVGTAVSASVSASVSVSVCVTMIVTMRIAVVVAMVMTTNVSITSLGVVLRVQHPIALLPYFLQGNVVFS